MRCPSVLFALALLAVLHFPFASSSFLSSAISSSTSAYHAFAASFNTPGVHHPSAAAALDFLHYDPTLTGSAHIVDVRKRLLQALNRLTSKWTSLASAISPPAAPSSDADTFPYWRMIPAYVASLIPNSPVSFSSPCFANTSAIAYPNSDGSYSLSLTLSGATSWSCSDSYLFATLEGLKLETFSCLGPQWLCDRTESIKWSPAEDASNAELWDISNKGVRIFRFTDDVVTTLEELKSTLALFHPLSTQSVSDEDAALNIDFLAKYANVKLNPRSTQHVPINASLIHSGDFFGVLRLDGLDPMLAWAMGARTGHTVLALWMGKELFIIEVTNSNSYWDVNGVQATPYLQWLEKAQKASYNVVWAPLSPTAAAAFNESAAIQYFLSQQGFDYGYQNLLWGWQDTVEDNYPCLPPHFDLCLTPHHVQILFGYIDRAMPSGRILFLQAWNKRIGTEGLSFAEILQFANQTAGISAEELPVIVEKDDWQYDTKRYNVSAQGSAQVCCVFVCNVWRSAGLFRNLSDEIECAEQTNYDVYTMNLLTTPHSRPAQCQVADPNNSLCQIEGGYTLVLGNDYGKRALYPHMDERCPSEAPLYARPSDC